MDHCAQKRSSEVARKTVFRHSPFRAFRSIDAQELKAEHQEQGSQ
jgi:hypothetical protein